MKKYPIVTYPKKRNCTRKQIGCLETFAKGFTFVQRTLALLKKKEFASVLNVANAVFFEDNIV